MQAVMLAAGSGARLRPLTADTPKPLLNVAGRPIIAHGLDALAAAGVRDLVLVVGYRSAALRRVVEDARPAAMRVRFVENRDYRMGNARSLWAARDMLSGSFLLTMGDHLFEPAVFDALLSAQDGRCRLAIDRCASDDPRAHEATRVLVEDGRVLALGKELLEWNALDTGAFWCTNAVFDALEPRRDGELGAVFASLASAGQLDAVDVTGSRWIDIDTLEDLHRAEVMMRSGAQAGRGHVA